MLKPLPPYSIFVPLIETENDILLFSNGTSIATYSNRAGVLKDRFLLANGDTGAIFRVSIMLISTLLAEISFVQSFIRARKEREN